MCIDRSREKEGARCAHQLQSYPSRRHMAHLAELCAPVEWFLVLPAVSTSPAITAITMKSTKVATHVFIAIDLPWVFRSHNRLE